jgi:hypothetical protein
MTTGLWDDDETSPGVAEERGPLRAGKLFVTDGERATIRENLQAAHQALTEAWALWQERDRSDAWEYDYWDEDDVYGLENVTLVALGATESAWTALTSVTDAHEAQRTAAEDTGQDPADL